MSWTGRISVRAAALSIAALFVAGAGVALAHGKIAHLLGLNTKQVKQVKAIIKTQAHTLTVASAGSATTAANATTATSATSATNASELGGEPPSAFEPASDVVRTGLVSVHMGVSPTPSNTVPFASFGPFTLTLTCTNSGGEPWARLNVTSTIADSVADGALLPTAGVTDYSFFSSGASSTFVDDNNYVLDFLTPSGGDYQSIVSLQENYTGSGVCSGNAVILQSS